MNAHPKSFIFDAFNARFSTPEKVAETFIAPQHFWKLCEASHSLIVGPRGSGKTSLLKMLQTPAFRNWKHESAKSTFESLSFVGVFIPTDVLWDEQTQRLGEGILDDSQRTALVQSAVSLQVLRSLVTAVLDEFIPMSIHSDAGPRGTLRVKKEQETVDYLAETWRVQCDTPSFKGLRRALTNRLTDIGFFVAEERFHDPETRNQRLLQSGLIYPAFIDLVRPALECIDDALENTKLKWALCFDELELAPSTLREELHRLLRSTEQRIYFKLSISPYARKGIDHLTKSIFQPNEGDDFSVIPLWYSEKRQSESFSRELAEDFLSELGRNSTDLTRFFGNTTPRETSKHGGYSRGSFNYTEIIALRKKDPKFRAYLEKEGVDVENISQLSESDRARLIRKIMPVILHRNYFLRASNTSKKQQTGRSRKLFSLYTGWQSIAAISEGNPRILKGLISSMMRRVAPDAQSVSREIQWDEIESARHKFRSKLKTIPITTGGRDRGVLSLLDVVGMYFRKSLLGMEFVVEPISSFTLDLASAAHFEDAVGSALNAGALVLIEGEKSRSIVGSVREKRFRLSYLMATHYYIPLRIGPHISLTSIFAGSKDDEQQLLLPNDEE